VARMHQSFHSRHRGDLRHPSRRLDARLTSYRLRVGRTLILARHDHTVYPYVGPATQNSAGRGTDAHSTPSLLMRMPRCEKKLVEMASSAGKFFTLIRERV
jgi:hypothetical protein